VITDLFPQPIWIRDSEHAWDYRSMISAAEPWARPHALTVQGQSTYAQRRQILELPEFHKLHTWLDSEVSTYLDLVGSVNKVTVINSWVNWNPPESSTDRHSHQLSRVSGVFYLEAEPWCSPLRLYSNQRQFQGYDFISRETDYNQQYRDIGICRGRLILFPGWMEHSVPKTAGPRTVLSFNTVFV